MKITHLALITGLGAFSYLAAMVSAQADGTPEDSSGAGPCGNPLVGDPPGCPDPGKCGEGEEPDSVGSDCDNNSISSFNGNAHRIITDLNMAGSVGRIPLSFTRYSNTRLSGRNLVHSSFGPESPWSHNYEWVMRDDGGTETQPIVKITFPNGKERRFRKNATNNIWRHATAHKNPDQIISNGDDFVLHTANLEQFHFKRRFHSDTGGLFYRIESIRDPEANVTTISYLDNDDTRIRQVTDSASNWIKLHYRDESLRAADATKLNPEQLSTQSGAWQEIHLTPGDAYRMLVFYQGHAPGPLRDQYVREIEFYDENDDKITGTIFGSEPWKGSHEPALAMDGNTSTFYQYKHTFASFVGIDLGAGNASQVSRIRFAINGAMKPDAAFYGLNNELTPNVILSHIEGSDGREVHYEYDLHTEDDEIFQWIKLASATYPDETSATYTYNNLHLHTTPLLETANDPRYHGSVKQVRYRYAPNNVIGFIRDEFDNVTNQPLVSLRWDSANDPKFVYPNGKVRSFNYWGGNAERAADSFGAVSEYTYLNGLIVSHKDPLGRVTNYERRTDSKIISKTTPGGSVTSYARDAAGHITSVTRNGKTTSHVLDPATKRRTRTNHPDGSHEEWEYNTFGQITRHRHRNATIETWTYSSTGLLIGHTDTAGTLTSYTHDALKRRASQTRHLDANTAYTTSYEYDDRGSITKTTHPDGTFTEHLYDTYGNHIATLDERGQLTQWTYDSLGRKLTATDPNGHTTTYDYTSSLGGGCGCNTGDRPVTITYPDGTVTLNSYDMEWRLLSTTHAFGSPQAATTSYAYDLAGQRVSMTDPLGRVTTYGYDADGRVTTEIQASGTPVSLTNTRSYSVDGNLLSATQGAGSSAATTTTMSYDNMDRVVAQTAAFGTAAASTTSRAYNALGQLVSATDPLGRVTTYTYDTAGRPRDTILPDGTTMRTVHDGLSRTIQSIAALGHPEEAVTSMTYDSRDRVVAQTDPTGVTTATTYDGGGLPISVTIPSGKSVAFIYDASGNRLQTITAPGTAEQAISATSYDSRNRPVTRTDGEGSVTTLTYDSLGRTLTVTDALNHTTTYTYDLVGNRLTARDADNLVTSTRSYDALDRLSSDKDGKNQTIAYQYDALGRKTAYTDAKGATFSFQFDALGRLTQRTEPDSTFQTYTYDAASRLLVHTKADFKTKTHHYENAARDFLTKITYSNGEAPRLMSYDHLGRLLGAANAHATITRSYDAASRQLSETQAMAGGPSGTFAYQYDSDGNPSRHTRPDGSFIDYTWNARNLLASVISDAPPPVATYTYNLRNQISGTVIENGLFTAARGYDTAGRLTGVTNGALDSTGYTLSADGRRTGINRNGTAETYGYDDARQVTSASYPDLTTTQSWNYDAAGNRSSATTNGLTTTYLANLVNEYTSITGAPAPPMYDPNGNAVSYPVKPLGSTSLVSSVLSWDINNQLVTAANGNGDSATYQYDALGRRTKRSETLGGVTTDTWFFTNGWNVELEYQGSVGVSPAFVKRHTWGLDLSNSMQGAGGVGGLVMTEELPSGGAAPVPHFPTYDGNGNITAWVNASGTVEARLRYDAFGNIVQLTDGSGTPITPQDLPSNYGFSTKPMETVTGLLYYGYRYYDPVTGRWPSRDPIEEMGGINLYGFVRNDSIGRRDVLGMHECTKGDKKFVLGQVQITPTHPSGRPHGEVLDIARDLIDDIQLLNTIMSVGSVVTGAAQGIPNAAQTIAGGAQGAVVGFGTPGPDFDLAHRMINLIDDAHWNLDKDDAAFMRGSMILVNYKCCVCKCRFFTRRRYWDCNDQRQSFEVDRVNDNITGVGTGASKPSSQITAGDIANAINEVQSSACK